MLYSEEHFSILKVEMEENLYLLGYVEWGTQKVCPL